MMQELTNLREILTGMGLTNPFVLVLKPDEELLPADAPLISEIIDHVPQYAREGSLIISGSGGDFGLAIELAVKLKRKFKDKMITYIPERASSAMAYFALLSNEMYCSTNLPLGQCDLLFMMNGNIYQARRELNNNNSEISGTAKKCWGYSGAILKSIMELPSSLYLKDKVPLEEVTKVMNAFMRDNHGHDTGIRLSVIQRLGFNAEKYSDPTGLQAFYTEAISAINASGTRMVVGTPDFLAFIP